MTMPQARLSPVQDQAVAPAPSAARPAQADWTIEDADALYGVDGWGAGYASINKAGHLCVHPDQNPDRSIDLFELIEGLGHRNLYTPILIRFTDILAHRLSEIRRAFDRAIENEEYKGGYSCVYPIKVNQQRNVLEEIRDIGLRFNFGLEAGSKPELLAVLGMTSDHKYARMPIICNGFKDREFIQTVVLATKLGRNIVPVVEKFSELELLVEESLRYGVRPKIGVRIKLSAPGVGRWEASGGIRSKFGLTITETLTALDYLKKHEMQDCLNLLHFHLGSQICDIRNLKNAVTELAHIYTELHRLGAGMTTIDIGGGLGVDYDGTNSANDSSTNYSVDEYAADVVYRIKAVCDSASVPHPNIISESGRAMVAHSSVLVFDVLGSSRFDAIPAPDELEIATTMQNEVSDDVPQPITDLHFAYERSCNGRTDRLLEAYHDAAQARQEIMTLFGLGYLSLPLRSLGERLFWATASKILERVKRDPEFAEDMPSEFAGLPELLSDHYFCNLSIFQSIPDSWAIDQLFPICPIHRLDERPTRRGVLADITCDSDGKIDHFIDTAPGRRGKSKRILELHNLQKNKPYYLAAFLVGAYQEILGDLHNLFGDTHAVHVSLDDDGEVSIDEVIPGDTVRQVLSYVQIDHNDLRRAMRRDVERAVRAKELDAAEAGALMRFYEQGLDGYTYLED